MTAGNILLEAAARAGYYALMTRTSGPQIRGGEAAAMLRISTYATDGQDDRFQILAAIDWQNVQRFASELPLGAASLILGDPAQGEPPEVFTKSGARYAPIALKALAAQVNGWPNMVALGALAGLVGLPPAAVEAALRKSMKKGLEGAIAAARVGFSQIEATSGFPLEAPAKGDARWLITGNEAAGYGALRGGVRFVAAYPITPATELLEWLAPALAKVGGTLVQAEDELASINMALGASFGGVPALTATSGPGLSLMIEALGLGVAAEVPLVVVDVMRTGPSTGIATKSEQADLDIALHGLHGDAPHIVVAPNSISDCVAATEWAVGLAESLQVPAIVLSDQYFGQARAVVDVPHMDGEEKEKPRRIAVPDGKAYRRYAHYPFRDLADGGSRHGRHRVHRRRPGAQRARPALLAGGRPPRADGETRAQDRAARPGRGLGEHRGRGRDRGADLRLLHRVRHARRSRARAAARSSFRCACFPRRSPSASRRRCRASGACSWSSRTTADSSCAICARSTSCPPTCAACAGPARCRSVLKRSIGRW